jgi:hypothetical protein
MVLHRWNYRDFIIEGLSKANQLNPINIVVRMKYLKIRRSDLICTKVLLDKNRKEREIINESVIKI